MLETLPRKGKLYAQQKYTALLSCADDAQVTGISLGAYACTIRCYANIVQSLDVQIRVIDEQIEVLCEQLPKVALLKSIPGIGDALAPIVLGEIGDIDQFMNAKQLVAFSGIDPSVKQSGNLVGIKNKVTKRGPPFLRHALYIAATTSIRKELKGSHIKETPVKMTENSSPPQRVTMSAPRTFFLDIVARLDNNLSPAAWPYLSLIALKLSISIMAIHNCSCLRVARASVKKSVWALKSSFWTSLPAINPATLKSRANPVHNSSQN